MSASVETALGTQALIFLVVTAAACLQGSIGFGFALVAAPILVLIDPSFVPGAVMLSSSILTVFILYRERSSVDVRPVRWAVLGNLFGATLAGAALSFVSARGFGFLFGAVVLAAVFVSALGIQPRVSQRNAVTAGVASGFMGTTSSIGGPPMALLFQGQRGAALRGNLAAYFLFSTAIGLTTLTYIGRFGYVELQLTVCMLPGVFAGFLLSLRTARFLDRRGVRPVVLVLSGAAAIAVIVRAVLHS